MKRAMIIMAALLGLLTGGQVLASSYAPPQDFGVISRSGKYVIQIPAKEVAEGSGNHRWRVYILDEGLEYRLVREFDNPYPRALVYISDLKDLIFLVDDDVRFVKVLNKNGELLKTISPAEAFPEEVGWGGHYLVGSEDCQFSHNDEAFIIYPRSWRDEFKHIQEYLTIDCNNFSMELEYFETVLDDSLSPWAVHRMVIGGLFIMLILTGGCAFSLKRSDSNPKANVSRYF